MTTESIVIEKYVLEEKDRRIADLEWKLNQFKLYGTTDCENNNDGYMSADCHGRVTLFIANTKCIGCDPKAYEPKQALAKVGGV